MERVISCKIEGGIIMNTKHKKGMQSKLAVMKHFVDEGYYVYHETNNVGPVDLVAIHPETKRIRLIEVKTMSFRSSTAKKPNTFINRILKPIQKDLNVSLVYYNLSTGEIKDASKKV